jgi:hypothetical protein
MSEVGKRYADLGASRHSLFESEEAVFQRILA